VNTEVSVNYGPRQPADLARVVGILRGVNYRGFVTLEYEAAEEPRRAVPLHLRRLRELIA